jgi:hypothetical protein
VSGTRDSTGHTLDVRFDAAGRLTTSVEDLISPPDRNRLPRMDLPAALRIDASYRNTNNWQNLHDVFNRFFRFADGKGINNTSGFRPKSRAGGSTEITDCAFCILVTTFGETDWPDSVDLEAGTLVYYGDNRSPGRPLDQTAVGGNRLLETVFSTLHGGERQKIRCVSLGWPAPVRRGCPRSRT